MMQGILIQWQCPCYLGNSRAWRAGGVRCPLTSRKDGRSHGRRAGGVMLNISLLSFSSVKTIFMEATHQEGMRKG